MKPFTKILCLLVVCFGLLTLAGCKRSQEPQLGSAQEVLDAMVAAYQKAETYSDSGEIRLVAELEDQKIDDPAPFSVVLVRPNKIAVRAYQAEVTIDGEQTLARLRDLREQALVKDPPAKLTAEAVYCDPILADKLMGRSAAPPQLALFLEKEPLKHILRDAGEPELGEAGEIDGRKCYRVQAKRPGGAGVETLWIDQQTFVLRRIEYPMRGQEQDYFPGRKVKSLSLVADFKDAQFNAKIDDREFQIAFPPGAEVRKYFLEPDPRQLLARTIDEFTFVDLDGNPINRDGLAGKITVLCFWECESPQSRQALEQLEKLSQPYAGDSAPVRFLAVSADPGDRDNKTLIETADKWGVHLPMVRDNEQCAFTAFRTMRVPTLFVLDGRGGVQYCEIGVNPDLVTQLAPKLEELVAGKSIYGDPLRRYREELARQERMLSVKAAERSQPATLKLTRLWKSTDVVDPGNILVVDGDCPDFRPSENGTVPFKTQAASRLLVLSGPRTVAEVALDGKLLATHPLDIHAEQEAVTLLQTAVAGDGTRYFAAFAPEQQRVHVFDAKWKKLFSYPPDALEKDARHLGIADCALADLEGDGKPKLYIGYLGVVGVQAVSLEGKRLFANRMLANVCRLAAGDRDSQGRRQLLCGTAGDNVGTIALLDEKLERRGEVLIPDCPLRWFACADLQGEGDSPIFAGAKIGTVPAGGGKLAWCGLTTPRAGENVVVGLDLAGKETWKYALPEGMPQRPIVPVVAGRATGDASRQWLLPGVDGSVHVLTADGKLLDQFNYGAVLGGMAAVTIDGKPALVIASPNGLEALRVE
jgi:outer membrane lipoprotein-sorting protein